MDSNIRLYGYDHDAAQWVEAAVDSSGKLLIDLPSVIPVDIQAQSFSPLGVNVLNSDSIRQYSRIPSSSSQLASFLVATSESLTQYTVPVGKTLFLSTSLFAAVNQGADGVTGSLYVYTNTDSLFFILGLACLLTKTYTSIPLTFNPPLELPAGYYFKLSSWGAGFSSYGVLHGFTI